MGMTKDEEIAVLKAENADLREQLDRAYQSLMSWRHAVDVLIADLKARK
jgi:hypothetical protein